MPAQAQAAIDVLEHFLERSRRSRRTVSVDDIQLYFVERRGPGKIPRRDYSHNAERLVDDVRLARHEVVLAQIEFATLE